MVYTAGQRAPLLQVEQSVHVLSNMANTAGSVTPGAAAATVQLNVADRSLDCQLVDSNIVSTYSDEGFGYLWSGVRATHGILGGRCAVAVPACSSCDRHAIVCCLSGVVGCLGAVAL
jgi:hypothetical protein